MEVEYNSQSITWDYDLFSTLSFPSQEADLKDKLNLDVMRKHYYEDILAATYSNGDLALWNTSNSQIKGILNLFPSSITELQWFLDSQILASHQNIFGLFDLEKQKEIKRFKGHSNIIMALKPLMCSNIIASAGSDKIIILWDTRDSKPINVILAHSLTINSLDFSCNRDYLMSAGGDGYCRIWSLFNSKAIKTLMVDNTVYLTCAKFNFNSKYALVSSLKSNIALFDLETSEIVTTYIGHSNEQYFIENAFGFVDGTQKLIISGSEDGKIYIWEAESGNLILKKNINPNNNVIRGCINEYSENSNELYINCMGTPQIEFYKANLKI